MTTYWCEYAWLGGETVEAGVTVEVAGDRLASLTRVDAPPQGATRLSGLTLPGLVNAHSHAFHRALRGRTHRPGDFWSWRDQMYALAARLDPDHYRSLATAVFAEMALAGITTVGEFHYLHHAAGGGRYDDPNQMGKALLTAAEGAGVRITLLDTCYLRGGIDERLTGVQERFGDGSARSWVERVDALAASATAKVGAAVHSVRAADPESIALVAGWARDHGAVLHAHVSEQPAENQASLERYGRTPTELLAEAGAIGPSFTAVHATHLTKADVSLLGQPLVCLCPTTERDLGDGVGPSAKLVGAGARLCLGSDSQAVIDLFEEARLVELHQRLISGRRGVHAPADLLRAATAHGATSLGWEAGALETGKLADFVTLSLDGPRLAGLGVDDLVGAVVFAATASNVTDVVVGGRPVVRRGVHLQIGDVGAALRAAIAELG